MEPDYRLLSGDEVNERLGALPGWQLADGMLTREFRFGSYKEGLVFACAVGWEAERLNHHPDLKVGYGAVHVATVSHDAGGLTPMDFRLAQLIDSLTS